MREILFRGKTENDIWYYGDLLNKGYDCNTAIWEEDESLVVEIIPETVGQYTGLTDKNGNKIFEGDIVRINDEVYYCRWADHNYEFEFVNDKEDFGIAYAPHDIEIIGNVFDNFELLGG